MQVTQQNLIEQEIRQFFLGDRGGRSNRAFLTEIAKPVEERDIPKLKKEFFDIFDRVINDLYLGPPPTVSGEIV